MLSSFLKSTQFFQTPLKPPFYQHSKKPTRKKTSKKILEYNQKKRASHQLLAIHFSKLKITIEVTNKKKNFIGWLQHIKALEEMKETQTGRGFLVITTIGECHSCNVQGIHGYNKHPPPPPTQRKRTQKEFSSPSPCLM